MKKFNSLLMVGSDTQQPPRASCVSRCGVSLWILCASAPSLFGTLGALACNPWASECFCLLDCPYSHKV